MKTTERIDDKVSCLRFPVPLPCYRSAPLFGFCFVVPDRLTVPGPSVGLFVYDEYYNSERDVFLSRS